MVHKIDRLARNLVDHATIKALLKQKDIRLVSVVENCEDEAETYLLVIGHYLAGEIDLPRAADLLDVSSEELSARFQRLKIPVRAGEGDE